MSDTLPPLVVQRDGNVITWTLQRPAARNALDRTLASALLVAVQAAASDRTLRGAILTGAGEQAFCSGADLKERQAMGAAEAQAFVAALSKLCEAIAQLPFPTIAAVNGVALGGGMELALACDLRLLAAGAIVGLPEVSVGIMPGAGGTQRLPRLVGAGRAKELIFTARRLDAATALEWGIANHVVPAGELRDAARDLAQRIAAHAPLAVRQAKHAIDAGLGLPLAAGLALEQHAYAPLLDSRDRLEGLAAFAAKRAPRYTGE